jgi:hypothetical protein
MNINIIHFIDADRYLIKSRWHNLYVDGQKVEYGGEITCDEIPEMYLQVKRSRLGSVTLVDGTILPAGEFNEKALDLLKRGQDEDENWIDIDLEYQYKKLNASIISNNYIEDSYNEPLTPVIFKGYLEFKDDPYIKPIIESGSNTPYLLRVNVQFMDLVIAKNICDSRNISITIPNTGLKFAKISDKYVFYSMPESTSASIIKYDDLDGLKNKRRTEIENYINAVVTPINGLSEKSVSDIIFVLKNGISGSTKHIKDNAIRTAIDMLLKASK